MRRSAGDGDAARRPRRGDSECCDRGRGGAKWVEFRPVLVPTLMERPVVGPSGELVAMGLNG